jgi:hypothetical protein
MNIVTTSPTYAVHFYRGHVIEPTPLGAWMFYRERDDVEVQYSVHAFTVADAVRQIDAIEDGLQHPGEGLTLQDAAAFAAVALLTVAAVLWLGA